MTTPYGQFGEGAEQPGAGPFLPPFPMQGPRHLYTSIVEVRRVTPELSASGDMSLSWTTITDVVDVWLGVPGQLACRLDIGFIRRGIDLKPPLVAGRAPDRVGVAYFDPVTDSSGRLLVKAGDRLVCVGGPVYGTFDVRQVPDIAQSMLGANHVEVQVFEVAQQLQAGDITPFPGGAP